MTKSIQKYVAISLAALYSFSATAGSFYDSYQAPNFASARKIVTVERESDSSDSLVISTLCRDDDHGPYERCEPPMLVSENALRIIAIQEAYEQMRIFNRSSKQEEKSSSFAAKSRQATLLATFLIPGLAIFVPIGPAVGVLYVGLWLVSVISSFSEDKTKPTKALDPMLLAGSAGLVLKALDEDGVAMSRADRADAIPGVYLNLGLLAQQQQQQLDKIFAKTHQHGLPSRHNVLAMAYKFMGWAQHFRQELKKLTPQQTAVFEGMLTERIYSHQQALSVSAVNLTTKINALLEQPSLTMTEQSQIMRDYAFLTMLAGE